MNSERKRPARVVRSWLSLFFVSMTLAATVAVVMGASSEAATKALTPLSISHVPSSNVVYVLATTGCAQVSCIRLVRTTIDTATLSFVTPPPVTLLRGSPSGTLDELAFADVKHGYAITGESNPRTLYVTLDGAKTWHSSTIEKGASILGLAVTAKTIYAETAVCSSNGDTCHDFRFDRSSLGARKWEIEALPRAASPQSKTEWLGAGIGAYGSEVWISEQPPGQAVLFYSSDGGRSFKEHISAKLGSLNGCGLTAESPTALWAECPTGMQESFFFSKDAGTTWLQIPQSQFFGTGGGTFDPVSSTLAYLDYGALRPLVRISDFARVSTKVGILACSKINSSINDLDFYTAENGLALCLPGDNAAVGRLESTNDGGKSWVEVVLVAK